MDLVDLFGRGYVMEHCMSTLKLFNEQDLYKSYVTTALKFVVHNTARQDSVRVLKKSYDEMLAPPAPKADEKMESEQIIENIRDKLRKLA